uniref:Uncharacterized protein n=1 Tax=Zooxanthella nutricula TaxID=1333877 RepID=A0A7S2KVI6_9DINO|mmetsp:Transcript_52142/g.158413  ORF Transcript_52142/g.158413 Transcript_52142/m.158413 type:complete len:338 (+) Transcript_52142:3-1016(+)
MGWFVQAEAPPGALFKTFRNVVVSGAAKDSDVAFYFVHWFADLAGAEPYPLDGCNKFVLKFPQHVLGQFLASFSIVQDIAVHPETRVLEEYYKSCWEKNAEGRPLPAGPGSIAQMRLVLMAQGDSKVIIDEYNKLSFVDKKVLNNEMACTGCAGQQFQCDPLTGQETAGKGPAILVYYGPALLQKPGRDNPRGALVILTEIYRKTRELFPLSAQDVGNSVTVRIDAAKDLECDSVLRPVSGQYWVVSRSSNKDAMLKSLSASELKDVDWSKNVVLSFDKAVRTPNAPKGGGEFGTASVGLASTGSTPWTGIGARVRRMSLFGGSYLPGSWSPSSREE